MSNTSINPILHYSTSTQITNHPINQLPNQLNCLPFRRHHQFPMLYAFDADEPIRDSPNIFCFPPDRQNFQAVVMIEMHMHGGDNLLIEIVLNRSQNAAQIPNVMVINDGHRTDGIGFVIFPLFMDQFIADEITDCFGAVGVISLLDKAIEFFEQMIFDRDTETDELAHICSPVTQKWTSLPLKWTPSPRWSPF